MKSTGQPREDVGAGGHILRWESLGHAVRSLLQMSTDTGSSRAPAACWAWSKLRLQGGPGRSSAPELPTENGLCRKLRRGPGLAGEKRRSWKASGEERGQLLLVLTV